MSLLTYTRNKIALFKTKLDGDVKSELQSILSKIYQEHKFEKLCISGFAPWCDGEESLHEVNHSFGWHDTMPSYRSDSILYIYQVRDFFYDEITSEMIADEEIDYDTWVCPYEKIVVDNGVINHIDELLRLIKPNGYICLIDANGGDFNIKLMEYVDG